MTLRALSTVLKNDQGLCVDCPVPPEIIIAAFFCSLFTVTFIIQGLHQGRGQAQLCKTASRYLCRYFFNQGWWGRRIMQCSGYTARNLIEVILWHWK